MAEEMFDVVDEFDRVVEQLPRSVVHARGLLHRAVSIFVFNTQGELLVHLRSRQKDEFASCWTSSASGHVSAGESYDEAAPRELAEEVGLRSPLEFLVKLPGGKQTANEFTVLYRTVTDDPPTFDPAEIETGEFVGLDELTRRVQQQPELYTPPFRELLRWYISNHEC